jgi:hypothetical protein
MKANKRATASDTKAMSTKRRDDIKWHYMSCNVMSRDEDDEEETEGCAGEVDGTLSGLLTHCLTYRSSPTETHLSAYVLDV